MARSRMNDAQLEGVRIVFRNFAGDEKQFNPAGKRNFNVVLDDQTAAAMKQAGWNVKTRPPREEGDGEFHVLKVNVSYKIRPPRVIMITSKGRNALDEDTVALLDWAEIETIDMIIHPSEWEIRGEAGVSAYLKTMYVTIREDPLDLKYADIEDSEYEPDAFIDSGDIPY